MSDKIAKVIRDGRVAVLYAPGYGAGWYSWNLSYKRCVFEPEIVDLVLEGAGAAKVLEAAARLYGESFYPGGADDLEVSWVPEGSRFLIHEYDGNESVEVIGPNHGLVA